MMDAMRNAAKGWVAKVLIGLLAVSFAIWGIADVFTGFSRGALATAGDVEVTPQAYDQAFRNYLENVRRQTGQTIALDDARKLGMDRAVLETLISDAAIDSQARSLRLAVSDEQIVAETQANPAFQDSAGKFDPDLFRRLLVANGLSEAEYAFNERRDLLREAITGSVEEGLAVPLPLIEAIYRHRNEQRDARYFVVTAGQTEVAAPSDDEIKKEYEANPAAYTAPEYRSIALIKAEPADIIAKITLTDDDLKAGYERTKKDYFTPETRTILQLTFASVEDAQKAKERIASGTSFEDIAKEMNVAAADYTFENTAKTGFLDQAIADAAFALAEGAVSEPVKGGLATVLLKAVKVTPERQAELEEVKDKLTERLKLERAREEIQAVRDAVEDSLGGQQKLEDIAKANDLPFLLVRAVDEKGLGKDGKPVDLPHKDEVVKAAYASDVGVENPLLSLDEGYVWYEVREVVPSAVKPLEDVKDQARAAVLAAKLRQLTGERAAKFIERLKGGAKLDELAREADAEIKNAQGLKRGETSAGFDRDAVEAVFAVPEGSFATAPEGTGVKIIQSAAVLLPPFNAASVEAKALADEIRGSAASDILASYQVALKKDVGVTVNETLWRQITGTASQ